MKEPASTSGSTQLGEQDRYFFNEGKHWQLWRLLGAHPLAERSGVRFSLWAPNAQQVSVVGDFNSWQQDTHPLRLDGQTGIWSTTVPEITSGEVYKYHLVDCDGESTLRSDPVGFAAEVPPQNASIVADLNSFQWGDQTWVEQRPRHQGLDQPISVYELHLGSWRTDPARDHGWKNYRTIAQEVVEYCQRMQFTHIELLPISEHPYTGSWGYQTVGYYAATSRYGAPDDLMYFVDYCHRHRLGVLIDWVPAHFPRDAHGLRRFDGTALYEHLDPRLGEHPDWGTMIFNYGRDQVKNFLIANALFWIDQYHIDGLRVDAVASMLYLDYSREEGEWIPNRYGGRENLEAIEFLQEFNDEVHRRFPGVLTMAEESTAWDGVTRSVSEGGLGFDLKWNMGWMNDTLKYMRREPVHRKYHHDELTFSIIYSFSERFMLPFSHDEVVHGKRSLIDQMPGDQWQQFANLRLLYAYMWTHPGKKLLFMGSEFAQWHEWNCNDALQWQLLREPAHQGIQQLVVDLNALYREQASLHQQDFQQAGFEWIDHGNAQQSVISYLRWSAEGSWTAVACNFTPVPVEDFKLGLPEQCRVTEVLNTDAAKYGGTGAVNAANLPAERCSVHGREFAVSLKLPPLGAVVCRNSAGT